MRRLLAILITLAILGVMANDISRYAATQMRLRNATYDLTNWAGQNAETLTREQAALELARMAQPRGVVVYQYGQTEQGAQVWTQAEVNGTLVAGRLVNLLKGKQGAGESTSPTTFIVRDYREAGFK